MRRACGLIRRLIDAWRVLCNQLNVLLHDAYHPLETRVSFRQLQSALDHVGGPRKNCCKGASNFLTLNDSGHAATLSQDLIHVFTEHVLPI